MDNDFFLGYIFLCAGPLLLIVTGLLAWALRSLWQQQERLAALEADRELLEDRLREFGEIPFQSPLPMLPMFPLDTEASDGD